MSVERVERDGGTVWRVRWREGPKARSRVIGTKRDALHFDAEIRRRKRLGDVIEPDRGSMPLDELKQLWWRRYVKAHLADRTRRSYEYVYGRHIQPYLGNTAIRELTVDRLEEWVTELRENGIGEAALYRSCTVMQSMLAYAEKLGKVDRNNMRLVRKPKQRRVHAVTPLNDEQIAALMAELEERDKLIVALMVYAGLRPSEALGLTWENVLASRLRIDWAKNEDGGLKETKNEKRRTVPITDDLRRYLDGGPEDERVVGVVWNDNQWRRWWRDFWLPAVKRAGLGKVRPYDLRHTFASRLIHDGRSVVEVARIMGHTPYETLNTYAHVFEEAQHEG